MGQSLPDQSAKSNESLIQLYTLLGNNENKIAQLKKWQEKSRDRKKDGIFVSEGLQEASLAYQSGFEIVTVLYCSELISLEKVQSNTS